MEEDNDTILKFACLGALTIIPLILFVLGIISRQTAYLIFLPAAAAVIIYLLVSLFKKRDDSAEGTQTTKANNLGFSELESSEVKTVEWSRKRR
jgi:heme/copper-type cytochrome/quinol oxidase subunit 4